MKKCTLSGLVVSLTAGLLMSQAAHADSINYYLSDTNVAQFNGGLPDGTNYLMVTIDDEGGDGIIGNDSLINFSVEMIDGALTTTNNFGVQSFAFNITGDAITLTTDNIIFDIQDTDWDVSHFNNSTNIKATNADGYGKFDVVVSDGGQQRRDPLTFSIDVAGDSLASYFDLSVETLGQTQPTMYFAAHLTGIETGAYTINGNSGLAECAQGSTDCLELSSAWFGAPATVVPVPAAVWLFGSGLIGLAGIARRKTA